MDAAKRLTHVMSRTLILMFLVFGTLAAIGLAAGTYILSMVPTAKELRSCMTTSLYKVRLCPGEASYITLNKISPFVIKALIVSEDSAFYQHHGFDFQEMENSMKKNLKKGHYARGGSTISQQLAKNLFLNADKTLYRKAVEAMITVQIERNLSKKEILEKYLNVVQFGKNIFGIKKAAESYFKKSPEALNLVESAFLIFLLPSPEKYSVSFAKHELTPFGLAQIHRIIDGLYRYGKINQDEYAEGIVELETFLGSHKVETLTPEQDEQQPQPSEEEADPNAPDFDSPLPEPDWK